MNIDLSEVTIFMGKKNSGKSVAIEYFLTQCDRFVAIDPNHEHGPPGATVATTPSAVLSEWLRGNTRIIIRDEQGALEEDRAMKYARIVAQLPECYLIIDEAHKYMTHSYCPGVLAQIAKWVVTHQNCGLVFGVHTGSDVPTELWSQVDNYVIFPYGGHEDSKMADLDIPREDKQKVVDELDEDSYQFLTYSNSAGVEAETRGPVPLPEHLT